MNTNLLKSVRVKNGKTQTDMASLIEKSIEPVITIENICQACEKGPCEQPCELWYKCLEGTIIKPEDLE